MVLAGMDFSGDGLVGNRKFMGIVIGTQEGINAAAKSLGPGQIHMRRIRSRVKRNVVVSKLRFDSSTTMALCIWLDKDSTVRRIRKWKKIGHRYPTSRIVRTYDYILYRYIQDKTAAFFAKHGCVVSETAFQCDSDCKDFVKSNGLERGDPGDAHMLADIVAWSNNNGREPAGVSSVDLRDYLESELRKRFG